MYKPTSSRPLSVDFSHAGKRRRHRRHNQQNSPAEPSAGKPAAMQGCSKDGLLKQIEQESVVEKEKVRKIKAAIAAGTYEVNADTIADKMLELEVKLTERTAEKK